MPVITLLPIKPTRFFAIKAKPSSLSKESTSQFLVKRTQQQIQVQQKIASYEDEDDEFSLRNKKRKTSATKSKFFVQQRATIQDLLHSTQMQSMKLNRGKPGKHRRDLRTIQQFGIVVRHNASASHINEMLKDVTSIHTPIDEAEQEAPLLVRQPATEYEDDDIPTLEQQPATEYEDDDIPTLEQQPATEYDY
jgi:hypothetical protein